MGKTTTEESGWTKANLQKLLAVMKSSIPENDRNCVYTKGLKTIDWGEVAFPPFSPEECKEKWKDILQKMRKIRTLTELIVEAEDVISDPGQNIKIHPELPKRPRPPNALFFEENYAKYQKKHPEMNQPVLFKHMNKKFRELSDEKKDKYVKMFELAKEEYSEKMEEFSKKYKTTAHHEPRKRKRLSADTPDGEPLTKYGEGMPPKPPVNGCNLFYKETRECGNDVTQRWHDLTEEQREEYSARCKEMNLQYSIKLNEHLENSDEEEQQLTRKEDGIKTQKEPRKYPGEPKMPSRSGYTIFFSKHMQLLKEEFPIAKERFAKVNQMWRALSCKKKESYREEVEKNVRKYSMELQEWFQTLTAAEQEDYWICNSSKLKYLDVNKMKRHQKEVPSVAVYRPSDSEDEDIEDSSSEEEDHTINIEDEEEEDDDNDVIMFEMC
ncbi:nucleolar transcription factor 1-B-like [Centropristis striata]|uniref:nucleolar transcription factor 1-B-like n=1 Tax=Centropristis striata TaxID=184440 RepID=UPI0027DFFEAD|nr:nucleolar transcription factor 1-B-like [Centropristis striata]